MKRPIYFDGEPDRFARTLTLMQTENAMLSREDRNGLITAVVTGLSFWCALAGVLYLGLKWKGVL